VARFHQQGHAASGTPAARRPDSRQTQRARVLIAQARDSARRAPREAFSCSLTACQRTRAFAGACRERPENPAGGAPNSSCRASSASHVPAAVVEPRDHDCPISAPIFASCASNPRHAPRDSHREGVELG